jgi:hypothetical protein
MNRQHSPYILITIHEYEWHTVGNLQIANATRSQECHSRASPQRGSHNKKDHEKSSFLKKYETMTRLCNMNNQKKPSDISARVDSLLK